MEKQGRVMFLGKWINSDNEVRYRYVVVKDDNTLGREWNFKKNIFSKGTVGSVYGCSFEDDSIIYKRKTMPSSILMTEQGRGASTFILFPKLRKYEEENRQTEIAIRNSKKPVSPLEAEIKEMKATYKSLSPSKRCTFIGNLIYKITN